MTLAEFVEDLNKFCKEEVADLLAKLQELRFKNQGDFNGNPAWIDNDERVIEDKGFNSPLYDTGELFKQLTTPSNWKVKLKGSKNKLTISIPDEETFTSSKYDVLDSGGYVTPWKGHSKEIFPPITQVPARPFKSISAQDVQWIRDQLLKSLKDRYER